MWGRRSSARSSSAPRLKDRRRQSRRRFWLTCALLSLLALGALLYALWQPALRVSTIEMQGADALLPGKAPEALAKTAMTGAYFGIVPHNSTLFLSEHRIRAALLAAHPEVAAISIAHDGLTGLIVRISPRTAVGRWCGLAPTEGVTPYCYLYDPNGFIYVALPDPLGVEATTTMADLAPRSPMPGILPMTLNPFGLYAPLVGNRQEPLRATIAHSTELPDALNFARQVADPATPAKALVIHGDEADIILASGTRLTYVLGHEEDAYSALKSAHGNFNLLNGSVDYVDLRFSGKVYVKRRVDSQQETVNSQ